jgi:uncharacterized protein YkwD
VAVLVIAALLGLSTGVDAQPPLDGGGGWTTYPDPNENTGISGQNALGEIPANPTSFDTLANIAAAFSNARSVENSDLCPSGVCESGAQVMSTAFSFPSGYAGWSGSDKALWLINSEREARGLLPFAGTNASIDQVAQDWADYLADNNLFFHNSNARADIEAVCSGCVGNIGSTAAENLFSRSYYSYPNPGVLDAYGIENAIYLWMYVDRDGEGTNSDQRWGHRHALLWDNLTNDNGSAASEGYIGVGVAKVPASCCGGFEGEREVVVWNAVDSNAAWPASSGATCGGEAVTVDLGNGDSPTAGADVILGTSGNDTIYALGGDDVVCAEGGNDTVVGGAGNDTIYGGAGNDLLSGNADDDVIYGEGGADRAYGGSGADLVDGGADDDIAIGGGSGSDTVRGRAGADTLSGGSDADVEVSGGDGNDAVNGGSGDDANVHGNDGDDTVSGNGGNDIINGDAGDDEVRGGNGDDYVYGDSGDDFVAGNDGTDTCDGGTTGESAGDTAAGNCEVTLNVP